jgi:peptide-methionine (S)-S-oxide reductase
MGVDIGAGISAVLCSVLKIQPQHMKAISIYFLSIALLSSFSHCAQKSESGTPGMKDSKVSAPAPTQADLAKYKKATFAAGCFWCEEGVFESVKGVSEVISGYAGGDKQNPTYEEVGSGSTGHAESVEIYYDSAVVDYKSLLRVFFASQDPTQVNGQGPDWGTQYRSIVFYRNEKEKQLTEQYISELNASGKYSKPIATQVVPYKKFWQAEDYHQNYIDHHPENPYVQHESIPRLIKTQKQVPDLIRPEKSRIGKM